MGDTSMNRYEQQLYSVFKTFDVGNEEALDKSAVHELCDALQLEDRGADLVGTLFERSADRVTFAQFRNGLLAVLGGAENDEPASVTTNVPAHSDDDSSGREVAPKFVFGSKKYGRRSRPTRASLAADEPSSPRSSSASRVDSDDRRARQRGRCRRSTSAMESREESARDQRTDGLLANEAADKRLSADAFEHDRRIDRDEALALCHGLSMDRIDHQLIERIFEDSGSIDTTVGEFFNRLNASLTITMAEAARVAGASSADEDPSTAVSADLVLDAWESAGVQCPRRLLADLGFTAPTLQPSELESAIDHELRTLPEPVEEHRDARSLLLLAALVFSRLRLEHMGRCAHVACAERDKLRADLAEANRRAGLLAQEVDESHARLENELQVSLRRAEARHAEAARQAAADAGADRERATAERNRLEAEVSRRAEAEARLRADAAAARVRADELESRVLIADQRLVDAEREHARLAAELRAMQERVEKEACTGGVASELLARLHEMRHENQLLRDRNDELCAALETRAPPTEQTTPAGGYLSMELNSLLNLDRSEECDSATASIEHKAFGPVETVATLREVIQKLDTMPTFGTECQACIAIAEVIQAVREKVGELCDVIIAPPRGDVVDAVAQTDASAVSAATDDASRTELADAERRHEEEKRKLTDLIRELECSLEQMRAEYDTCEEYWSGKLAAERAAGAEEQRLGDERLADLVAKISEYERQFGAGASLPPIEERHSLEAQFTDLEEEFARYRADKEAELEARRADVARLAERVRAHEAAERRRVRDAHDASPAEVRELRARTIRAEAAARRLHARLAAADLLVKELYVENCQLAHRRPL